MAAPSVIANVKARATRANVTPRLRNSAPELASATAAASTAGGRGSFPAPASRATPRQTARNTAHDSRRGISVSGDGAVEWAGVQLRPLPHQLATAHLRPAAIKHARLGL